MGLMVSLAKETLQGNFFPSHRCHWLYEGRHPCTGTAENPVSGKAGEEATEREDQPDW